MQFAIDLPNFGEYSSARLIGKLAREAEVGGGDGCFIWDHVQVGKLEPVVDPWIALTVIALMVTRIRCGPLVTPLFRRHPWKIARGTVTLDRLSRGRLILGVGLGSDLFGEISTFDGPVTDKVRAEMLDEGLAVITGLWSGTPFAFAGRHCRVGETLFVPTPYQSPRIPIWVASTWPKTLPLRRAVHYDGAVAVAGDVESSHSPTQVTELVEYIMHFRKTKLPFEIVQFGGTPGIRARDTEIVAPFAAAGATWWIESMFPLRLKVEDARTRIRRGPPRLGHLSSTKI